MAITVPVPQTMVSVVGFGRPVVDEVNRLTAITTPGSWIVPSFTNGYTNAISVAYRKIGNMVYLRGRLGVGTIGSSAFVMPIGHRSSFDMDFVVPCYLSAGGWTWGTAQMLPTGTFTIQNQAGAQFIGLNQCFWEATA